MNPDGLHTKVIESLHYPGGLAIDAVDGYVSCDLLQVQRVYSERSGLDGMIEFSK